MNIWGEYNTLFRNKISKLPKASLVVIGNEILSGRTNDKNINFIAKRCDKIGINLNEVRVIPDDRECIKNTVLELSNKNDYVFTTGGIGPTHDDVTTESIAYAFDVKVEVNKEAVKRLIIHYKNMNVEFNKARAKMAKIPLGAKLIDNPVSSAPGFIINNVYVFPGVPSILQEMFLNLEQKIKGDKNVFIKNIKVNLPEGEIAEIIELVQNNYEELTIGSYPFFRPPDIGSNIVLRSLDESTIITATNELVEKLKKNKIPYEFD